MKYLYFLTLFVFIICTSETCSNNKELIQPAKAIYKSEFNGLINGREVNWIETDTTIKYKAAYENLCSSYFHSFKKNNSSLDFIINLGELKSDGYLSLTKLFYPNYSDLSFQRGVGNYCLENSGMQLRLIINNDRYYLQKPSTIIIKEIQKFESECECNKDAYFIQYQIKDKNIDGILSLKYFDPCCKTIEIK
ncbi:MAG: hypothetical protein LCH67_18835 [Bacteroidetes bacterium]|nr:hypothetical protein [Bacteroidota bacterium]